MLTARNFNGNDKMVKSFKKFIFLIGTLVCPGLLLALEWEVVERMQVPRSNMCIATLESPYSTQAYLIGGLDQSSAASAVCEVYSIYWDGSTVFEKFADSLNIPRYAATAFSYQGQIYVLGGLSTEKLPVTALERYDPGSDTWEILADSVLARQGAAAIVLQNMHYVIGGWSDHSSGTLAENFIVKGSLQDLSQGFPLQYRPVSNVEDMRAFAGAASYLSKIYISGGLFQSPGNLLTRFDTITGDYQSLVSLPDARAAHTSVVYHDSLLIIGGFSLSDSSRAEVLALPLRLPDDYLKWDQLKPLNHARESHVTVLLDNQVFVFGGFNRNSKKFVSQIEKYGFQAATGIYDDASAENTGPAQFTLSPNYPNPFNQHTRLAFEIQGPGIYPVQLKIYDVNGHDIRTLVQEQKGRGQYFVDWDGSNASGVPAPSGVYFLRSQIADQVRTQKMLLIR